MRLFTHINCCVNKHLVLCVVCYKGASGKSDGVYAMRIICSSLKTVTKSNKNGKPQWINFRSVKVIVA